MSIQSPGNLKKKRKNPQKYKLLLNYLTERHQILYEHYWGFAWPPHQILAQSINIEQSYGLSKSRYTPKNEKNEHFFFIKWKQGGNKVPKFSRELSLMLSTIVQNFKKFRLQVFPKNMFKFQKNQNFTDKFFLNTIPRPKFVTNDNNFLLDNKYGCNWCPHQILAKLVNIWPNYEYPKSRKPSKKKEKIHKSINCC